jgi:hypothetical protein
VQAVVVVVVVLVLLVLVVLVVVVVVVVEVVLVVPGVIVVVEVVLVVVVVHSFVYCGKPLTMKLVPGVIVGSPIGQRAMCDKRRLCIKFSEPLFRLCISPEES